MSFGEQVGEKAGTGRVGWIDFSAAHWQRQRAMDIWRGQGLADWYGAARRARDELETMRALIRWAVS